MLARSLAAIDECPNKRDSRFRELPRGTIEIDCAADKAQIFVPETRSSFGQLCLATDDERPSLCELARAN